MKPARALAALLGYAAGSLRRRWGKSLATLVGLAVVTAAFASAVALTDALREEARRGMGAMPEVTVSRLRAGRPALLDAADAARLARIEGVAAVIFDEFHERSLDADLGLALAVDVRRHLREDLRLLVMSATIDGAGHLAPMEKPAAVAAVLRGWLRG